MREDSGNKLFRDDIPPKQRLVEELDHDLQIVNEIPFSDDEFIDGKVPHSNKCFRIIFFQ